MKIIEKKCPNCHANLDFKVGDTDISCKFCRRKFAIIYDHNEDFYSLSAAARERLSSIDFSLVPFKNYFKIHLIAVISLILFVFAVTAISIVHFNNAAKQREQIKTKYEEFEQQKLDIERMREEANKLFEEKLEEAQNSIDSGKESFEEN